MTERSKSRETQSHYLALINALIEAYHHLDKVKAPSKVEDGLLDAIRRCRADYNERFPSSPLLPPNAPVA